MGKYFTNPDEDLFNPLCPDLHVPAEYLRVWRIHEEKGSIQLQQVETNENSYGVYLCCFKTTTNIESLNALNGVASTYFTDAIQA
ncbi:Oidioi.mRNA.OKI2018_I69.XSR.g14896.t1.cds [Oikopleura dioica]|uniref:Oidioi.mRNA.OKI2018_I69.XSR.g14896.t1.cds n=1 Tax=Oikopleura dioica TaxID=34765 RepID=A0ABN7SBL5_OIKDI|nr:Oidioi.mRNA.OKI2018_I69.XSR.g14896.t1.cds [Oikopleura dioica]